MVTLTEEILNGKFHSVSNFQSMKCPVELNSLFSKFFFFLISKFLFYFKNFQIKSKINLHVAVIHIYKQKQQKIEKQNKTKQKTKKRKKERKRNTHT